ncbi:hypothetical protein [Cryobacterium sp. GrIS_2_6]|uniref:hypothetical protein n=1 Tax=Cryobacterium sp. GrIS_2_6 TaxID=3162785 RepID=UPI002DFF9BA4|nr:hypothetical protein [Cryobacterium psychrotolerans]
MHDDLSEEHRLDRGAWVRQDVEPSFVRLAEIAEQFRTEARKLGLSEPEMRRLIEGV